VAEAVTLHMPASHKINQIEFIGCNAMFGGSRQYTLSLRQHSLRFPQKTPLLSFNMSVVYN
jgi:hypothetical protein